MKNKTVRRLKERGWSEEDIRKTEGIIEKRKREDKSRTLPSMNRVLYWSAIVVIVLVWVSQDTFSRVVITIAAALILLSYGSCVCKDKSKK